MKTATMKGFVIVLIGLFSSMITYSQDNNLKIEKSVSEYYVDTLYSQIEYHVSNPSDSTFILWIEQANVDSLSNQEKIKKHFFTVKGDWSLMQLIWDGNVESFIPGLFDSIFKVIKPKDQFTVTILYKGEILNNSDLINSFGKRISIVYANEIKGLQMGGSIDMFNYKTTNLILLADWFK